MIIEGLLTLVAGVGSYFLLPNSVSTAWFLKPEERELAKHRLRSDTSAHLPDGQQSEGVEKFRWSEVRRGILNVQLWLSATAYFSILSGLYSFGLFLPSIIKGLGYTANEAQLWSVIPYAVAAVVTVVVAFLSDKFKLRGVMMLSTLPLAIIGYAVIGNVGKHDNHTKIRNDVLDGHGVVRQCASGACLELEQFRGTLQTGDDIRDAVGDR